MANLAQRPAPRVSHDIVLVNATFLPVIRVGGDRQAVPRLERKSPFCGAGAAIPAGSLSLSGVEPKRFRQGGDCFALTWGHGCGH